AGLALSSRSIVMCLPIVLVSLDVCPLRSLGPTLRDWMSPRAWPVWREKIPFVVLAVAAAVTAYYVQRTTGYLTDAEPAARVVMVLYYVWFHVWKTGIPLHLAPLYDLPSRLILTDPPYL